MMTTLLGEIFSDSLLSRELCFKGGTAAYLFGGLPRFSTDLDFNLRNKENEKAVYERLLEIASGHGDVVDSAQKHFGPIVVMNYAKGERNLKMEVSNRLYDNHYEVRSYISRRIPVMVDSDMFSHKLCATLERSAPRDVYDCWYFASRSVPLNPHIIYERTGMPVAGMLVRCADRISSLSSKYLMAGLGDVLLSDKDKNFVRNRLIVETEIRLRAMAEAPLLSNNKASTRAKLLELDPSFVPYLLSQGLDIAAISERDLLEGIRTGHISTKNSAGIGKTVPFGEKFTLSDVLGVFEKTAGPSEGIYLVTRDDGRMNYITEHKELVAYNWLDKAEPFKNGHAECTLEGTKVKIDTSGIIQEILSQNKDMAKGTRL